MRLARSMINFKKLSTKKKKITYSVSSRKKKTERKKGILKRCFVRIIRWYSARDKAEHNLKGLKFAMQLILCRDAIFPHKPSLNLNSASKGGRERGLLPKRLIQRPRQTFLFIAFNFSSQLSPDRDGPAPVCLSRNERTERIHTRTIVNLRVEI